MWSIWLNLRYPSLNILKWMSIYYWISKYNSCSTFIISLCNIFESLLTSCVPNLHFVFFIMVSDCFNFKINSYSCDIWLFVMILAKSSNKISFSNTTISNNNNFDHLIKFLFLCFHWNYIYYVIIFNSSIICVWKL